MIVLETNNLSKKYGSQTVVNNVNMVVEEGDIYGFVGENGAGKTTLIRLVTGLISPTSGSFTIYGKKLDQLDRLGNVAAVVESPSIYPYMNAVDNIKVQSRILGVPYSDDFCKTLLSKVGLGYLFGNAKKAKDFSLGMRQRLSIAMALAGNPKFLLLDEPMNGLDPEGIVGIRNLILDLNKHEHITFLISSHMLSELSKVATKYCFISYGKIVDEITALELHEKAQGRIEFSLSSSDGVMQIIGNLGIINYSVIGNKLTIYDTLTDYSKIIVELAKNGVQVINVEKIEGNIEEYYLKLLGGRRR